MWLHPPLWRLLTVDKSNQKEPQIMKDVTRTIKRTNRAFAEIAFEGSPLGTIADLIQHTKEDFDLMVAKIKVTLVEFLLFSERESLAGPDYAPVSGWQKWGGSTRISLCWRRTDQSQQTAPSKSRQGSISAC